MVMLTLAVLQVVILTLAVLQVVEVSTSKTGKQGHAKCHFVGIDMFNAKKLCLLTIVMYDF